MWASIKPETEMATFRQNRNKNKAFDWRANEAWLN